MDFFAQQDKTRRKTKLLVFYFAVAVVLIIAMIYFVVLLVSFLPARITPSPRRAGSTVRPCGIRSYFSASTLGTLAVIFIGSVYKTNELSGGGSAVADLDGRTAS